MSTTDIATLTLTQVAGIIGTIAKFFRVLIEANVSWEQFRLIIDDKKARHNLADYLKLGCPQVAETLKGLLIRHTISIGTCGIDKMRWAGAGKYDVSPEAHNVMYDQAFKLASQKLDIHLVVTTARELGFQEKATRKEIYDRAIELGLYLCPAEVGPQLRKQFLNQPFNEWLLIAMEPIQHAVFAVIHTAGGLSFTTMNSDPDVVWNLDQPRVFSRK